MVVAFLWRSCCCCPPPSLEPLHRRLANVGVYEGQWENDKRHGTGKLTYVPAPSPGVSRGLKGARCLSVFGRCNWGFPFLFFFCSTRSSVPLPWVQEGRLVRKKVAQCVEMLRR